MSSDVAKTGQGAAVPSALRLADYVTAKLAHPLQDKKKVLTGTAKLSTKKDGFHQF